MDLGEGWSHVVRGGRVVRAPANPTPTPQPVTESPKLRKVATTSKTARPKKPVPKAAAATKPVASTPKKEATASIKTAGAKPKTPKLVDPNHYPFNPLEEISDLLDHLPLQACVEPSQLSQPSPQGQPVRELSLKP